MIMSALRSILTGTMALSVALLIALGLTIVRRPVPGRSLEVDAARRLLLVGLALQTLHFGEELLTGFHERWPRLLGLAPWSTRFFVTFNLVCLVVWFASSFALRASHRPAFLAAWFFAIAMAANGVAHPVLALAAGGYFPGLVTSPAVGAVGLLLLSRLSRITEPSSVYSARRR
jgi:hypothetical protein